MDEVCEQQLPVDFGDGTVMVRCTEKGPHTRHRCLIEFSANWKENPIQQNIFEVNDGSFPQTG